MNTDAEGRLVLADGLIDASEQNAPLIIDAATLTGAAKTALGNDYHALFSFDDELAQALLNSAHSEHELFWRLPLAEFHRSQLPSNFAELNNVAGGAYSAGASTAAAFLSHFVKIISRAGYTLIARRHIAKAPLINGLPERLAWVSAPLPTYC